MTRLCCHQDKGIGQDQALYYTAYATFLEMRGAHARAREVYADGLARCATAGCLMKLAVTVVLLAPALRVTE